MTIRIALLFTMLGLAGTLTRGAQPNAGLFAGRPKVGERMTYLMTGVNENWKYQVEASGVVRKDSKGNLVEEYTWSHLVSNGVAVTLPVSGSQFRQILSLDPSKPPLLPPNLGVVPPALIGPILDFATFNVDLWLAGRLAG